jgi:tetratricopeptide (TPR) repeat protein
MAAALMVRRDRYSPSLAGFPTCFASHPRTGIRRWLVVVLATVVVAGSSIRASAQTGEAERTAAARALFNEGVEFADRSQWNEAADRFQRALSLRPSSGVAHNLALALMNLGRYVEASEHWHRILRDPTASPQLRTLAESHLAEVEPRIGRLTVRVTGDPNKATIQVGRRTVTPAELGVPLPIDPGSYEVTATQSSQTVATQQVSVTAGGTAEVTLELSGSEYASNEALDRSLQPAGQSDTSRRARKDGAFYEQWWFWTAAGVVIVGVTVGAVLLSSDKTEGPIGGNASPPVLRWP